MNRIILYSAGFILLATLAILLFHSTALVLSLVFIALAIVKHIVIPIKKELAWFMLVFLGGAVVEIVLVNIGRAWVYSNPEFLGIPLYMPLFWGLIGTSVISLYQGLTAKK